MFHRIDGLLQDTNYATLVVVAETCHECTHPCVECNIPLSVRPVLFSDGPAYKARMCISCYGRDGGESRQKRNKAE